MPAVSETRGTIRVHVNVPSQSVAATGDNFPVWRAPANATIDGASFTPADAVTANGTNFATYTLTNKGTGAGSTPVATRAWSATNSVASTPDTMALNGTPANLQVNAGDSLEIVKSVGGSGLVIPDGLLVIDYQLR